MTAGRIETRMMPIVTSEKFSLTIGIIVVSILPAVIGYLRERRRDSQAPTA